MKPDNEGYYLGGISRQSTAGIPAWQPHRRCDYSVLQNARNRRYLTLGTGACLVT